MCVLVFIYIKFLNMCVLVFRYIDPVFSTYIYILAQALVIASTIGFSPTIIPHPLVLLYFSPVPAPTCYDVKHRFSTCSLSFHRFFFEIFLQHKKDLQNSFVIN
jgi:hypothetical protein